MMDRNYGQRVDNDQFGRRIQPDVFEDEDVVEDVESIQEPYPANEETDEYDDTIEDADVENPDEHHEYDDKDHPHEYKPPSAVINDYKGASGSDRTNAFEQQNPLQSNYPASDSDR
ncbi:MAG TPA: hypothetical protein VHO90_13525 [Bacteroidales bacterium]|nr:hypothetical protein [Bacteroidales bacterium]